MEYPQRFRQDQLERIIDEATIYMCACPAQVAVKVGNLRELIRYQNRCIEQGGTEGEVHRAIAQAASDAHAIMEDCLDRVLDMEGWDRETLKMPEGLRKLRDEEINRD